jgi:hypothetical protein
MSKHTPGPWYADKKGLIWRRPPSDLYQNGGRLAGDMPIATAFVGWSGEGLEGYPVNANARLIASAPELLDALKRFVSACRCNGTGTYESECPYCGDSTYDHYCKHEIRECFSEPCKVARQAIAKAEAL